MNLTPDYTLLIQIVLFLIVWAGLSRLAFAPTTRVLEERRDRTVAAQEEAAQMVAGAGADREEYERTVQERRAQMAAETAAARSSAQEESTRVLNEARESANQALNAQRAVVAEQIDAARQQLQASARDVADKMLERVTAGGRS